MITLLLSFAGAVFALALYEGVEKFIFGPLGRGRKPKDPIPPSPSS